MSFLSVNELVALKKTNPNAMIYGYGVGNHRASTITKETAVLLLDTIKARTLAVQQAKVNRPWELISLTDKLDPFQPWLGFEFETGFATKAEYDRVINFVWDNINHVAIDREGYGAYCPEITFSPQNLSAYMNKTADIYKTIRWMNENNTKMPANIGDYVGTHLNISTPAYRALARKGVQKCNLIVDILNHSILMMNDADMRALFGRVPYGLGNHTQSWVEFKLFRSTDDLKKLDGYMKVAKNFATVMEQLSLMKQLPEYKAGTTDYIPNFTALLKGTDDLVELDRSVEVDISRVGTRVWRSRYGDTYGRFNRPAVKAAA